MISVHFHHPHFGKNLPNLGYLGYFRVIRVPMSHYTLVNSNLSSVPQPSIFDPELLFEKQKSTPKDGLVL